MLLLASSAQAEEEGGCGPFDEAYPVVQISQAGPGVEPADASRISGSIINLPGPSEAGPIHLAEEVLLALPKDGAGALPGGAALGGGARVVDSFFSPVLCATIARIAGPPGAMAEDLVPGVPETATVVPNTVYYTAQAEVTPVPPTPAPVPDPYRPLQYALDHTGVQDARALSNGSGAVVAVLDSAADVAHRELGQVKLESAGEAAEAAVHGTLVAGVIAAEEDNGFGMAGVAPGASVLSVPVCSSTGEGAPDQCMLFDLLRGVDVAQERGAQVMNLSIVGPANPLLERSMSRLDALGVLVVASSGNEGAEEPRFPAAYPSVIGVGAADRERRRYERSNGGLSAELLAPGVEILSTAPGDVFAFGSGTSFAAAHVSGVLGVLIGAGIAPVDARAALFQTAHAAADAKGGPVELPRVCDVFTRLGRSCSAP